MILVCPNLKNKQEKKGQCCSHAKKEKKKNKTLLEFLINMYDFVLPCWNYIWVEGSGWNKVSPVLGPLKVLIQSSLDMF